MNKKIRDEVPNKESVDKNSNDKVLYAETKALVKYFELLDEDGYLGLPESALNKFWEISILGTEVSERSGKIGSEGKGKTKSFKSEELAQKYVEKMILEKQWRKDYTDKSTQLYKANDTLAAIIGSDAVTTAEAEEALDAYIKSHGLILNNVITSDEKLFLFTGDETFKIRLFSDEIRENLSYIPGVFRKSELKTENENGLTQPKSEKLFVWINLGKNEVLKGPYPKNMDVRDMAIKTEVFLHMPDVFKSAAVKGRPPKPNIYIANDKALEVLHFPSDAIGIAYAVIENLPNLREIHVGPAKGDKSTGWDCLDWLILQNLPSLQSITVSGRLRWLDIHSAGNLKTIDVANAKSLDHFFISGTPTLDSVLIKGCVKLRVIDGITDAENAKLSINQQINKNQSASKLDGVLYPDMTYTDVDHVLKIINQGVKQATRAGNLDGDFCYGQEGNAEFNSFSFRLLRPLEHVYTGGTGETYAYESIANDYSKKFGLGIVSSTGCSTQEKCLEYSLNSAIDLGLDIPYASNGDEHAALEFFRGLSETR